MSAKPTALEIGAIYAFLVKNDMQSAAKALLKDAKIGKDSIPTNGDCVDLREAIQSQAASRKRKVSSDSSSSSSSSDSDSSSEDEKPVATKASAPKKVESDSSSSDSDSSEDEAPAKKSVPAKAAAPAKKAETSSSSDSSSSSEDEAPAKKSVPAKAAAPAKKAETSSSSDSSSSSEDEAPAKKSVPAKRPAPAESSSSSDSASDSSSSEDEAPAKKNPEPPAKKAKTSVVPDTPGEAAGGTHKAYIKGLPWLATEDEVRSFLKKCGEINSVELPVTDEGRSTGTAYVRFAERKGLDACLAMDGELWPGTERWLKILESNDTPRRSFSGPAAERPDGCDTVFVGNLPWEIDEDTMRNLFSKAGDVSSVRFATDKETGEFRGFGHVSFYDGKCTEEAVKLAGSDLGGRPIRVDYAPPRERPSGGDKGGFSPRGRGGGARGGGRGAGGRGGGRGAGGFNKAKGTIAVASGSKMTFDE